MLPFHFYKVQTNLHQINTRYGKWINKKQRDHHLTCRWSVGEEDDDDDEAEPEQEQLQLLSFF